MTDELIRDLAKISAVQVISRSSVMRYKGTNKPLPEVARELNVDGVIEGSVLRSGDQVRITAQLIRASTDTHLWADSYERDLRDVLALQDEVARTIANEIKVKLTPQEQARLKSARPVNPEAYQAYLKGRYFWNKRTAEGFKKAIEYFQQAIEKDPAHALAYAGLADSYNLLGTYRVFPPKEAYPRAKAAAMKALETDATLAEPHASLAWVKFRFDWDWLGAETEFRRALALNRRYPTAHYWCAFYLAAMGRLEEASAQIKQAQELDPLSVIINATVGNVFISARHYDQAIEELRKTLELDPNFAYAHDALGEADKEKAMFEEAIAEERNAIVFSGEQFEYF